MEEVLITTSSFGESGKEPLEILKSKGLKPKLNPHKRKLKTEELIELADGCKWILAGLEEYNEDVFNKLVLLKCISRVGVGMDSIDIPKATERGIAVLNTPFGPTDAVAELALGFALNLLRKINIADSYVKKGNWQKINGSLLKEKTVGIIGFGRIGKRLAELLAPFKVNIVYYDPHVEEGSIPGAKRVDFDSLLEISDIISLHLCLDSLSSPIIGAEELGKAKRGAYLINLSRGEAVDERALYECLKSGVIAGAALDVFANEPYSGKLTELDNVILTPHIGSYAKETRLKMETDAVNNLLDHIKESRDA